MIVTSAVILVIAYHLFLMLQLEQVVLVRLSVCHSNRLRFSTAIKVTNKASHYFQRIAYQKTFEYYCLKLVAFVSDTQQISITAIEFS